MRLLFILTAIATAALMSVTSASAQTDLYVRGAERLIPISLPQLCNAGAPGGVATEIPATINRDLDLSGYFEVLNPARYIETAGKCAPQEATAYSDWSVIGSEGLVKGEITISGNMMRARLYLHDVQRQGVVMAKEYNGDLSQAKMIAHRFANEIMKYYTGEYGVFGTQIAFSSRVGRFKELFVMDMDGSNIRPITNEKALALSPDWDESGTKLVYTSYRNRVPDLFVVDVASRATRQITRTSELEVGAHFFGNQIITSRTEGSDSDILMLNADGGISRKLTPANRAIDVSPVPSPDGSEVVFCSNRAGSPQIYKMGIDGSNPRRVSFVTSNYCTSPTWSPKGDRIAFVCRADGNFQMFVADKDGGNPLQLTSSGSNEDPDFSPDGRYIVFSTTAFGRRIFSLALMRADGTSMKELTNSRSGDFQPSWGPLLR